MDVSVKRNFIGAAWVVTNELDKYHKIGTIQSAKWQYNTSKGAEAFIMLNFVKAVKENMKLLKEGSIEVFNNNLQLLREVNEGVIKSSDRAKDRGVLVCEIIETINMMSVGLYFQYADRQAKKKKDNTFIANPKLFLIHDCDRLAKETREECKYNEEEQISHFGKLVIIKDNVLLDKSIGEIVRISDTETNEINYLVLKFGENW